MKHTPLSTIYYSDNSNFFTEYEKRKNSPYAFSLGIKIHDHEAFFLELPSSPMNISRIYRKFAKLSELCAILPKLAYESYERNCLIDEIILTNDIEGVHSTRKEVMDVLNAEEGSDKKLRFDGMIKKYISLLCDDNSSFGVSLKSSADLRKLYDEFVLDEIKPDNHPDGEIFRKGLAEVVSATQQVKHTGVFPEEKIVACIDEALQVLNREDILPIYKIAVFHYLIGYIHPFYDGNGRLSRFISSYLLKREFNTLVALRLSYTIKNTKNEYYKAFDLCNNKKNMGELTFFLNYFCDVIDESIDSLTEKLESGKEILDNFRILLDSKYGNLDPAEQRKTSYVLWYLIQNDLFSNDPLDRKQLASLLQVSSGSARSYVSDLINSGAPIVESKDGRKFVYKINSEELFLFLQK